VADGSPSAKGSLEGYLVPSQEDPVRPDLVRRKLGLDIGSSLDKQPVALAQEVQHSDATRVGIENEVTMVDDSVKENTLSDFGDGGEKSELKQFKAELFSLYCGYFTSFEYDSHCYFYLFVSISVPIVEKMVENRLRWFRYAERRHIDSVVRRVD